MATKDKFESYMLYGSFFQALDRLVLDIQDTQQHDKKNKKTYRIILVVFFILWNIPGLFLGFGFFVWLIGSFLITAIVAVTLNGFFPASAYSVNLDQIKGLFQDARNEAHSQSPLIGKLALANPKKGAPYRERQSIGGKLKRYYRQELANYRFALADGSLLAMQLVTSIKTKAGTEVNRLYRIRGRIKPNPSTYANPFQTGRANLRRTSALQIKPVNRGQEWHLCFWGEVSELTNLDREIAEVFRTLEKGN